MKSATHSFGEKFITNFLSQHGLLQAGPQERSNWHGIFPQDLTHFSSTQAPTSSSREQVRNILGLVGTILLPSNTTSSTENIHPSSIQHTTVTVHPQKMHGEHSERKKKGMFAVMQPLPLTASNKHHLTIILHNRNTIIQEGLLEQQTNDHHVHNNSINGHKHHYHKHQPSSYTGDTDHDPKTQQDRQKFTTTTSSSMTKQTPPTKHQSDQRPVPYHYQYT